MSLKMTKEERETFLADLHVGVISINDGKRGPLTVPIWYQYSPAEGVSILTGASSKKGQLLESAGRFSLCAQTENLPYKYVSVEGPIVSKSVPTREQSQSMAIRYLGEEQGAAYAAGMNEAGQLRLVMKPERWRTVDYSKS